MCFPFSIYFQLLTVCICLFFYCCFVAIFNFRNTINWIFLFYIANTINWMSLICCCCCPTKEIVVYNRCWAPGYQWQGRCRRKRRRVVEAVSRWGGGSSRRWAVGAVTANFYNAVAAISPWLCHGWRWAEGSGLYYCLPFAQRRWPDRQSFAWELSWGCFPGRPRSLTVVWAWMAMKRC